MRNMKQLVQALAMAGIALTASTAHATLMTTAQTFKFNGTNFVSDDEGAPDTSSLSNASLGSATVTQFNASTGVLTGVLFNLSATQTQSTDVSAKNTPNTATATTVTSSGTGSSSVQLSASGMTQTFATLTQADGCTGDSTKACNGSASTTNQSTTLTNARVSADSLGSYVGSGTAGISFIAPTLSASQLNNVFIGTETTKSTVTWSGSGSVAYEYLLHAAGSFSDTAKNTLDLDFGTVFQGDTDPTLGFSIFNLANANRNGLDLDNVEKGGDFSILSTNFSASSNLIQGGSKTFSATFDTAKLGSFSAVYTFDLSDADFGESTTWKNSTITLNLKGTVAARAAEVPEPFSLALLGAGLLGIAAVRRRRG